jgi:hypothetical protein
MKIMFKSIFTNFFKKEESFKKGDWVIWKKYDFIGSDSENPYYPYNEPYEYLGKMDYSNTSIYCMKSLIDKKKRYITISPILGTKQFRKLSDEEIEQYKKQHIKWELLK